MRHGTERLIDDSSTGTAARAVHCVRPSKSWFSGVLFREIPKRKVTDTVIQCTVTTVARVIDELAVLKKPSLESSALRETFARQNRLRFEW